MMIVMMVVGRVERMIVVALMMWMWRAGGLMA